MDEKKEITKMLQKMSGKYSAYEVFADWVRACALSVSNTCRMNHDKIWQEREQSYLDTIHKYSREEQTMFCEMFAYLVEALEGEMTDVLSEVYMGLGMGNKSVGQFFTPFHISKLCAKLATDVKPDEDGKIHINEPSCGSGGMIIAAVSILRDKGIDFQRDLDVVAQDLDWRCVYMCYLQLSLLGIRATCVQGDTLMNPYIPGKTDSGHVLHTPAKMGMLI